MVWEEIDVVYCILCIPAKCNKPNTLNRTITGSVKNKRSFLHHIQGALYALSIHSQVGEKTKKMLNNSTEPVVVLQLC